MEKLLWSSSGMFSLCVGVILVEILLLSGFIDGVSLAQWGGDFLSHWYLPNYPGDHLSSVAFQEMILHPIWVWLQQIARNSQLQRPLCQTSISPMYIDGICTTVILSYTGNMGWVNDSRWSRIVIWIISGYQRTHGDMAHLDVPV